MLSFLLLPLYTNLLATAGFGAVTVIFSWFAIFNVFLAYGMETAFFRYYTSETKPRLVISTALWSILTSTLLFVFIAVNSLTTLSSFTEIAPQYMGYAIAIMALDALVVIPFAKLRAQEKPIKYAFLKTTNVAVNLGLNVFFLLGLPYLATQEPQSFWSSIYQPNFEISYIFIANLTASLLTLVFVLDTYGHLKIGFNIALFKRMLRYGFPVMLAGVAFTINEVSDKIMLAKLLPETTAASDLGTYAACYKLALFMTLFATAFRMGIEPFFFNHAKTQHPEKGYAMVTQYFVLFGSVIFLSVVVFIDPLKVLLIRDPAYWEAIKVVPLILLASFFLGIYHNLSVWYKVTDQTRYGAYISIGGAVITLVINYVFIPIIGYYAAAIATLVAYGCMMLASFFIGRAKHPVPYPLSKIGAYLAGSTVFAGLSFYAFPGQLLVGIALWSTYLLILTVFEYKNLKTLIRHDR